MFINLKEAHTNAIQNIFENKLYSEIRNVWDNFSVKLFLKSKKCQWVKNSKKLKNDVFEIALDQ